jgi:hypothetical protein
MMNNRDRLNIQEFLSAQQSGLDFKKLILFSNSVTNEGIMDNFRDNNKRDSENINIIS